MIFLYTYLIRGYIKINKITKNYHNASFIWRNEGKPEGSFFSSGFHLGGKVKLLNLSLKLMYECFTFVGYVLFVKITTLLCFRNFMFPSHESINYSTWHLNKKWWVGGKRMATTYRAFIKSYDFDEKKNKAPFALLNIHVLQ
jgi:hypothetical protein